jgi:hypothetical protein
MFATDGARLHNLVNMINHASNDSFYKTVCVQVRCEIISLSYYSQRTLKVGWYVSIQHIVPLSCSFVVVYNCYEVINLFLYIIVPKPSHSGPDLTSWTMSIETFIIWDNLKSPWSRI